MFNNFYHRKRCLVTGVGGVKGNWLAQFLIEAGAEVIGLDIRVPDSDSNFFASGLDKRITFIQGDITDLALMQNLLNDVDCIFNLAAKVLVGETNQNPFEAYRSNTLGVVTALEALRLSPKPKHAVFVLTDKVYKPNEGEPWVESDPLFASGPYAISKACAEVIIADYQKQYLNATGTRLGIARAGNVVIGGDLYTSRRTNGAGRIVPDCFDALIENRAPEIFSPNFTRPYTYGLDILAGYMTLMANLDKDGIAGEAFNFGPYEQYGVPNALLATKICELWGSDIQWKSGNPREEPFVYQSLSFEKSRRLLHWQPTFTLYESLVATTRWYKKWAEKKANRYEGYLAEFNHGLLVEHRKAAINLGTEWAK